MNVPQLDLMNLSQKAEIFYGRLRAEEASAVRQIVSHIKTELAPIYGRPIAVAGVGSILRCQDPYRATDIDLAVSGLKYTAAPGRLNQHSFQDVIQFTQHIQTYLETLRNNLSTTIGTELSIDDLDRGGSGPFAGIDKKIAAEVDSNTVLEIKTNLEKFGWYNSKGVQVGFKGLRNIDIQFVFNRTIEGWQTEQETMEQAPGNKKDMLPMFFYAML